MTFVEREGRMGGVDPLTVADLAYAVRGNSGAPDELASTLTVAGGITTGSNRVKYLWVKPGVE